MPMSQSSCGVENKMAVDGHNKVDTKSQGCSHLLKLSARQCRIIDPGNFLTDGPPTTRRRDRGAVSLQYRSTLTASWPVQRTSAEAGFQGGVYGDNMIAQKSSSYVSSDPSEWSHSWEMRKPKK